MGSALSFCAHAGTPASTASAQADPPAAAAYRIGGIFGTLAAFSGWRADMSSEGEMRATAMGLAKAWRDHAADVTDAIADARRWATAFRRPADPAAEPMPPFAATPMPVPAPKRSKGGRR